MPARGVRPFIRISRPELSIPDQREQRRRVERTRGRLGLRARAGVLSDALVRGRDDRPGVERRGARVARPRPAGAGTVLGDLVERTRVAREMHDTLLQSLLGVLFRLDEVATVIDSRASRPRRSSCGCVTRSSSTFARRATRSGTCGHRSCSREAWRRRSAIGESLTGERAVAFHLKVIAARPRGPAARRRASPADRPGGDDERRATRGGRHRHRQAAYWPDSVALGPDDGKGFDTGLAGVADGVHWGLEDDAGTRGTDWRNAANHQRGRAGHRSGRGRAGAPSNEL